MLYSNMQSLCQCVNLKLRNLSKTIVSVINPPPRQTEAPPVMCEEFLAFFITKINKIKQQIGHTTNDLNSQTCNPPAVLSAYFTVHFKGHSSEIKTLLKSFRFYTCQISALCRSFFAGRLVHTWGWSLAAHITSLMCEHAYCKKHELIYLVDNHCDVNA